VPLIAVGVFDYVHSMRALETLVAEQVEPIVDRSVTELRDRFVVSESNLQLLSQNVETERLYRAHATGAGEQIAETRAALEPFMREAWEVFE